MIDKIKAWIDKVSTWTYLKSWLIPLAIAVGILGGVVGIVWGVWLIFEWRFMVLIVLAVIIALTIYVRKELKQ